MVENKKKEKCITIGCSGSSKSQLPLTRGIMHDSYRKEKFEVEDIGSQSDLGEYIRSNCPLLWSLLSKKAQTNMPEGLIEYGSVGTASEIEAGRNNLIAIEKYLTELKNICGMKTVGDTYRKDLSGVDSVNRLAELFCEIALCTSLATLSGNIKLHPPTGKGTYSDCLFSFCGLDIFAEAKRYDDPWPHIEKLGDDPKNDAPYRRSISQRPLAEKPSDLARPRSMDIRSKLRDVHRQLPDGTLNILFVFHHSLAESKRYLAQAFFGDANFFNDDKSLVLESDGLFSLNEWRNISACCLASFIPEIGVIFPSMWKNPRAQLEIPGSVLDAIEKVHNEAVHRVADKSGSR